MFGRKKYPRIVGTNTPEVRHFRRQLRLIEWALTTVDPRTDVDAVRKLTTDHAAYREALLAHGVNHPAPIVKW